MINRPTKDQYYLDIALAISRRSTCLKRHYGCVIVNNDIIIATGYNGNPRGEENCCDTGECQRANAAQYTGYENCNAVHAEQNALIAAPLDRLIGATVYLACEENVDGDWIEFTEPWTRFPRPCNICWRMLQNAGVSHIINRGGILK